MMITKQVKHRRLLAVIASTIVGLTLAGCGGTSVTNPETGSPSSSAEAALDDLASQCLDVWLNTEAPQSAIDAGLTPVTEGQRDPQVAVVQCSVAGR